MAAPNLVKSQCLLLFEEKKQVLRNGTTFTWDWLRHLLGDGALSEDSIEEPINNQCPNSVTGGQCYKTFSICKLRIFVLSQSVCYIRMEMLTKDKYSSLLQKYVIYGQKKFNNIGPWCQYYKTCFVRNLLFLYLARVFVGIG